MSLPHSTSTSALMPPAFASERVQRSTKPGPGCSGSSRRSGHGRSRSRLFALSLASVRLGLFAALFVLYVSGYPALQFQERHIFHLEFIGWFALGFAASLTARTLMGVARPDRLAFLDGLRPPAGWIRATAMTAALWCALAVMVVAPLWLLRRYQQDHVRRPAACHRRRAARGSDCRPRRRRSTAAYGMRSQRWTRASLQTMGCMRRMSWRSWAAIAAMR